MISKEDESKVNSNAQQTSARQDFKSTSKLEVADDELSYNPFAHRIVDKPNNTFAALLHLIKSSLGTGVLAMPNAFNHGGIVFGSIMTVVIGVLTTHCVWILVETSHKIQRITRTPVLGYAETAEKVFECGPKWAKRWSRAAKNFVDYGMMTTSFSTAAVYIVFIANTFHNLLDDLFGWTMSVRIYILIVMVPTLFIGQIRTLKYLVPFSGVANALITATFGIVLYYIFNDKLVVSDKPLITSWTSWPMFFSTVIFAMMGIGVVMPLENSMKKPQEFLGFPSILLIAMITITVMYLVMGLFGFIRFGDKIEGSITLNLPSDQWSAIAGQVLIGVAILFTFGIQFWIPMDILLKNLESRIAKRRNISEIAIRAGMVIVLGVLGIVVPDIGQFIGLVGALLFATLGLFVPTCIEMVFLSAHGGHGTWKWRLWKNILLLLFSVIAIFSGSFVSIKEIIETYTGTSST